MAAPGHGGRATASSAAGTVATWALSEGGLYRLELGHRASNPSSGVVARAAGFVREGVERGKFVVAGERVHVWTYGRLITDPNPTTEVIELRQWPLPTNTRSRIGEWTGVPAEISRSAEPTCDGRPMNGYLTISIRTAPDDVSAAIEALRTQGTLAASQTLADKGLVLVVAGFAHDKTPQPLSSWGEAERQAAAARVLATLGAAGVRGEEAGFGYSRDGSFAEN